MLGDVLVYPSPVQSGDIMEVGFYINKSISVDIVIYDLLGRKHVHIQEDVLIDVYNKISIFPTDFLSHNIAAGVYVLVVSYEGELLGKTLFGITP